VNRAWRRKGVKRRNLYKNRRRGKEKGRRAIWEPDIKGFGQRRQAAESGLVSNRGKEKVRLRGRKDYEKSSFSIATVLQAHAKKTMLLKPERHRRNCGLSLMWAQRGTLRGSSSGGGEQKGGKKEQEFRPAESFSRDTGVLVQKNNERNRGGKGRPMLKSETPR